MSVLAIIGAAWLFCAVLCALWMLWETYHGARLIEDAPPPWIDEEETGGPPDYDDAVRWAREIIDR